MKTTRSIGLLLSTFAAACLQQAGAQITLTGTSYTNTFDTMEADQSLPPGWFVYTGATATSPGTFAGFPNSSYLALSNRWNLTTGKFANQASTFSYLGATNFLGTESTPIQTNEPNRCLAVRQTSSFGDPGAAFALKIADTLSRQNFHILVNLLNLDPAAGRTTTWTVDYGIGNPPTQFIPLATWVNTSGSFTTTHTNISVPNGTLDNSAGPVWIRMVALSAAPGSGNREATGIDNFGLTWDAGGSCTPASVTSSPASANLNAGATANFTVGAVGTSPTYVWVKNGSTVLSDDGHYVNSSSLSLTINTVSKADEGTYACIVSNSCNGTLYSQTSGGAVLTVNDPLFVTQPSPTARTNMPADTCSLFATAGGTTPLSFQWRYNEQPIDGATVSTVNGVNFNSTWNVTNVQTGSQGSYDLVVTNIYGQLTSVVSTLTVLPVPSTRMVRWDFNNTNDLVASPAPAIGSGTASGFGAGIINTFASGSFSDPSIAAGGANAAWNNAGYPPQGTSNKLAGVQFSVSTVGYKDIKIAWEQRQSATSSKYQRFQYTTDGTTFIDGPVITYSDTNLNFNLYYVDLAGNCAVANNPNFAYRFVSEWESTATGSGTAGFVPVGVNSTYGTSGTIRYDLMTVYGNVQTAPAPVPLSIQQIDSGHVRLSWSDCAFHLQAAPALVSGLFTDVPNATSPYTNAIGSGPQFFRLKY